MVLLFGAVRTKRSQAGITGVVTKNLAREFLRTMLRKNSLRTASNACTRPPPRRGGSMGNKRHGGNEYSDRDRCCGRHRQGDGPAAARHGAVGVRDRPRPEGARRSVVRS